MPHTIRKVCYDIFWHVLTYFDVFWHILTYFDIFWQMYLGTYLKYFDIFWPYVASGFFYPPSPPDLGVKFFTPPPLPRRPKFGASPHRIWGLEGKIFYAQGLFRKKNFLTPRSPRCLKKKIFVPKVFFFSPRCFIEKIFRAPGVTVFPQVLI